MSEIIEMYERLGRAAMALSRARRDRDAYIPYAFGSAVDAARWDVDRLCRRIEVAEAERRAKKPDPAAATAAA